MKKIAMLVSTICLVFCLTACAGKGSKNYTNNTSGRFVAVPTQTDLYYDTNTKIVYIIFNEYTGNTGYGYMSPYYADNGMPYMYNVELNRLEEIQNVD